MKTLLAILLLAAPLPLLYAFVRILSRVLYGPDKKS